MYKFIYSNSPNGKTKGELLTKTDSSFTITKLLNKISISYIVYSSKSYPKTLNPVKLEYKKYNLKPSYF